MANVDRAEAGRSLGEKVAALGFTEPPLVLAIGPGAVPVAFEVARALHDRAELDVFEVRPFSPRGRNVELGLVASGGVRVVHGQVQASLNLPDEAVAEAAQQVVEKIHQHESKWRLFHARPQLAGRAVVWVADIAGRDARLDGAVLIARALGASRVVAATVYGLTPTLEQVRADADTVVCLHEEHDPAALVGAFSGAAPSEDEVRALLERADEWRAPVPV